MKPSVHDLNQPSHAGNISDSSAAFKDQHPSRERRGRFAPTPSGQLHLGNARTALLSWLQMRSAGGEFVLRIEDTDLNRSRTRITEGIIEDLYWLGIDWDEGPDVGGSLGPYQQSSRLWKYEAAMKELAAADLLFPCFCSRADLADVVHAPHGLTREGPRYPGTCRTLTLEQAAAKTKQKGPSYRIRVDRLPSDEILFVDAMEGVTTFPAGYGGDFIIKRADGMYSYQLAVVVDDADMQITDVLRGNDLLDSTPRQLMLYAALGLTPPRFTHVPLVYGPDGRRLAKRHGGISLQAARSRGIRPEQIVGWLAYLSGLLEYPEPVAATELIAHFDLDRLTREAIHLSSEDLQRLQTAL